MSDQNLGNIIEGTWSADPIEEEFGGTGIITYTTGDLLYSSAANTLSKRAIGSSYQVLTVDNGVPVWAPAGGPMTVTTVSASPYTILVTDNFLSVTATTTTAVTINLPSTATIPTGKTYEIKDAGLNSRRNNITIIPNGVQTIEGENNAIIAINGASLSVLSDGTNWFVF